MAGVARLAWLIVEEAGCCAGYCPEPWEQVGFDFEELSHGG